MNLDPRLLNVPRRGGSDDQAKPRRVVRIAGDGVTIEMPLDDVADLEHSLDPYRVGPGMRVMCI